MTYFFRFWENVSQETRLSFIISFLLCQRGSSKTKPAAPFCCDLLYCLYSLCQAVSFFFCLPFLASLFQFKEISFAYEVLTNPEKKELYDRYGEQGLREGGGGGPGMDDIFSHIFGGGLFGFMGGQGRGRNGGKRRGDDMVHPLK